MGFQLPVGLIDEQEAACHIDAMHGTHRIASLLKQVDRLSRGG